jgi:hypothetical protein
LGVLIIKIMMGQEAYFRIDEMSSQEFVDFVRQSVAFYLYQCYTFMTLLLF